MRYGLESAFGFDPEHPTSLHPKEDPTWLCADRRHAHCGGPGDLARGAGTSIWSRRPLDAQPRDDVPHDGNVHRNDDELRPRHPPCELDRSRGMKAAVAITVT